MFGLSNKSPKAKSQANKNDESKSGKEGQYQQGTSSTKLIEKEIIASQGKIETEEQKQQSPAISQNSISLQQQGPIVQPTTNTLANSSILGSQGAGTNQVQPLNLLDSKSIAQNNATSVQNSVVSQNQNTAALENSTNQLSNANQLQPGILSSSFPTRNSVPNQSLTLNQNPKGSQNSLGSARLNPNYNKNQTQNSSYLNNLPQNNSALLQIAASNQEPTQRPKQNARENPIATDSKTQESKQAQPLSTSRAKNAHKFNLKILPKPAKEKDNILNIDVKNLDPKTIRLTYLYQVAAEERNIKKQYLVVGTLQSDNVVALESEELMNPDFRKKKYMKREKLLKSEAIDLITQRKLNSGHKEGEVSTQNQNTKGSVSPTERSNVRKQSPIHSHKDSSNQHPLKSYFPPKLTSRKASEPDRSRINLNLTSEENGERKMHFGNREAFPEQGPSFSVRNKELSTSDQARRSSTNPRERPGREYSNFIRPENEFMHGNQRSQIKFINSPKESNVSATYHKRIIQSTFEQGKQLGKKSHLTSPTPQLETEISNLNYEAKNAVKLPKVNWKMGNVEEFDRGDYMVPVPTRSKDAFLLDGVSRRRDADRIASLIKPLNINIKREISPSTNRQSEQVEPIKHDRLAPYMMQHSVKNANYVFKSPDASQFRGRAKLAPMLFQAERGQSEPLVNPSSFTDKVHELLR